MAEKKRTDSRRAVLRKGETQRKDGMYIYRWSDHGIRRTIYAGSLALLREKEYEIKNDKRAMIKTEARFVTLNELFELWKGIKRGVRDNTMKGYEYMWEMFVRDNLGKMRASELMKSDVRKFYNSLIEDAGLKVSTVDNVHTVLHQVLQVAVDDRYIRNNPSDGALGEARKIQAGKSEKKRALTPEQERDFLKFIREDAELEHWYPVFAVMLGTGMRVGEVTGLRWCDIDFDEDIINVDHTLVYYDHRDHENGRGCYYNIHDTKTSAGERSVPIMGHVREALQMEKAYQEKNGICCSMTIDGYTDFVFLNGNGCVQNQGNLNRAIKRIVKKFNLSQFDGNDGEARLLPGFSCHCLRHTFATRLCEAGVNPKVIQATLGHSDFQTTMNIYAEATERLKKKEYRELEKFLNGEKTEDGE